MQLAILIAAMLLAVVVADAIRRPASTISPICSRPNSGRRSKIWPARSSARRPPNSPSSPCRRSTARRSTSMPHELFNKWGIGKKQFNNGVLLLVAPNERRMTDSRSVTGSSRCSPIRSAARFATS